MEACTRAAEATLAAWNKQIGAYERQSGLLRAEREKVARGFEELRQEKDDLVRENDGAEVSDGDLLKINAGGRAISVTRRTLTQIEGSRLEALFSGRWEKRLLRDGDGRIFLDVNPDCFQALVDFLNERRITPPDAVIDPPNAGQDNKVSLECMLRFLGMDDLLEFSSLREERCPDVGVDSVKEWETLSFDEFQEDVQLLLHTERQALTEAWNQLSKLKNLLDQEKQVLQYFIGDENRDIVWLDVSGVLMTVKRSTLGMCKDSVLAKQFNDPLWKRKRSTNTCSLVEDWTPEEVESWAKTVKGIPHEVSTILRNSNTRGIHLLAMSRKDFKEIGIPTVVLAVLTNAVEELRPSNKLGPTLIEHSSYCFGKIVDQLRIRAMQRSTDSLVPGPCVRERERKRFRRVVDYYFPGDYASFILGGMESIILAPSHVQYLTTWLEEDNISSSFELLYRASWDGWRSSDFHSKCDEKGSTVTVVRTTCGYIFGGFADLPWRSEGEWTPSSKAFLFIIRSHSIAQPAKLPLKDSLNEQHSLYYDKSHGPTFGGGYDLYISDTPNQHSTSYAYSGNTFHFPSNKTGKYLLTGNGTFEVAELEVFRTI